MVRPKTILPSWDTPVGPSIVECASDWNRANNDNDCSISPFVVVAVRTINAIVLGVPTRMTFVVVAVAVLVVVVVMWHDAIVSPCVHEWSWLGMVPRMSDGPVGWVMIPYDNYVVVRVEVVVVVSMETGALDRSVRRLDRWVVILRTKTVPDDSLLVVWSMVLRRPYWTWTTVPRCRPSPFERMAQWTFPSSHVVSQRQSLLPWMLPAMLRWRVVAITIQHGVVRLLLLLVVVAWRIRSV